MTVKISDVIKRLEELKELHGDIRVRAAEPEGGAWGEITNLDDSIWYCPEQPNYYDKTDIQKECISIIIV